MSNVIKQDYYISLDNTKLIDNLQMVTRHLRVSGITSTGNQEEAAAMEAEAAGVIGIKDQILKDAEEMAEMQVRVALEEAALLKEQADAQISEWWEQRRLQDEEHAAQAREQGYSEGYREGCTQAEAAVREEYAAMIAESRSVLEQAYEWKRRIIAEAEPFLVELSTAISQKIIHRQLTVEPDWIIGLTRSVLSRKREKGVITLCVSPQHISYFQEARDELLLAIDSQAELQIVPDATVTDHGCVIRTVFGSVDARVDTQLNEIKAALQEMALRSEEQDNE